MKMRTWLSDKYWEIRYAWQRAIRGYDDRMIFSFYSEHTRLVVSVLTKLQKDQVFYPTIFKNVKEWKTTIGKIIKGFEASKDLNEFDISPKKNLRLQKQFDEGTDLFKKYYLNL